MLRLLCLESGWGCSRWVRLDLKIPKVVLEYKIGGQGAKRRPSENDQILTDRCRWVLSRCTIHSARPPQRACNFQECVRQRWTAWVVGVNHSKKVHGQHFQEHYISAGVGLAFVRYKRKNYHLFDLSFPHWGRVKISFSGRLKKFKTPTVTRWSTNRSLSLLGLLGRVEWSG